MACHAASPLRPGWSADAVKRLMFVLVAQPRLSATSLPPIACSRISHTLYQSKGSGCPRIRKTCATPGSCPASLAYRGPFGGGAETGSRLDVEPFRCILRDHRLTIPECLRQGFQVERVAFQPGFPQHPPNLAAAPDWRPSAEAGRTSRRSLFGPLSDRCRTRSGPVAERSLMDRSLLSGSAGCIDRRPPGCAPAPSRAAPRRFRCFAVSRSRRWEWCRGLPGADAHWPGFRRNGRRDRSGRGDNPWVAGVRARRRTVGGAAASAVLHPLDVDAVVQRQIGSVLASDTPVDLGCLGNGDLEAVRADSSPGFDAGE